MVATTSAELVVDESSFGWHALRYSERRVAIAKVCTPFGVPQRATRATQICSFRLRFNLARPGQDGERVEFRIHW